MGPAIAGLIVLRLRLKLDTDNQHRRPSLVSSVGGVDSVANSMVAFESGASSIGAHDDNVSFLCELASSIVVAELTSFSATGGIDILENCYIGMLDEGNQYAGTAGRNHRRAKLHADTRAR